MSKDKNRMGGHIDLNEEQKSRPAAGSNVPAHKRATAKNLYRRHQNNPDTATAMDKARDTAVDKNGEDVIAAQE